MIDTCSNRNVLSATRLSKLAVAVTGAGALWMPMTAVAQGGALEEVIVTAQKRSESAQDVPIAISVFSQDMVEKTGVETITDMIPMIPGLTGSTYGIATNSWAIRGISTNDWTVGSEPSVAVFLDDAYVGRNVHATAAMFDVSRVEVVKGPQGTLFGRNAVTGAISITSNKPKFENSLRLGIGAGNEGQEEYKVVGNLKATDTFALRAAYEGTRLEGVWENVTQDEDGFLDRDSFRLMALWDASEATEVLLTLNYGEAETNMNGGYSPALSTISPDDEFPSKLGTTTREREEAEVWGANVRVSWDLNADMTLTSITDARGYDMLYVQDADFTENDAAIDELLGGITGGITLEFEQPETEQSNFYQEFRLNGASGDFDWLLGASYFKEDVDEILMLNAQDTAFGIGVLLEDRSVLEGSTESLGIYGDLTWSISDSLSTTVGARWSEDDKDWCTETEANLGESLPSPRLCDEESWSEITPRLVVDYAIAEDALLFASVSKGYKGGGFNASTADTNGDGIGDTIQPFDPETNLAYEAGVKSTWLDGALRINGSAYFNTYDDLQVQQASLSGIFISNAAEAETYGVEMEATYLVTSSLVLMANYSYLDAEFTSGDLKGNRLAYAPEHTYSLAVDFSHGLGQGSLDWYAAYNWQDEFFYQSTNNLSEDEYGLLNAKVTYVPASEGWDLSFSVDNITDEEYAAYRSDAAFAEGINRGMPRLYKFSANFYF